MLKPKHSLALLLALTGAFTASFDIHAASKVTLAAAGQPRATIVLPAKAPARLRTAALDLQKYIRLSCGVELPLREDGAVVPGTGLYIGDCGPAAPTDKPGADLNPESFAIRVRDGNILFNANYPTPTAFAVYTFLEDELGVRWFAPGDLWEDVPIAGQGELTVEVTDRVVVPDTSPRIWSGHGWTPLWHEWQVRNKTASGEVIPRRQFQNRIHVIFPPEKYAKEHPEYYPLCNGKRYIPPQGNRYWRPCESNPEVQRLVIEYIRNFFDKYPQNDSFSLGMDDISHLCGCDNCRAMDPHPDSYEKRQFSDRHYKFVNIIAKAIAETHPDRYIGTLIYSIALELPETVPALEPNVFGFITETSAYWWNEGQEEHDNALTREWRRRCQHLSRYDYYGFASMTPRYYPKYVDRQMKFDKKLGLEGMYIEVYTFLPLTMPMIWQVAKLQWDHTLDSEAMLADFRRRLYGDAEPAMTAFWNLLETSYQTPRPGRGKWEHRNITNMAYAMDPQSLDQALALLDQATAATQDQKVKDRIDIHRGGMQLASFVIRPHYLSLDMQKLNITSKEHAEKAFAAAAAVNKMASEREQFLAALEKRDDLLGQNYVGLTKTMSYMPLGNFSNLEFGVVSALFRALAWYRENAPQDLPAQVAKLGANTSLDNNLIAAYLKVSAMTTKPTNLLANGYFDEKGENQTPAAHDWESSGAPKGWNTWTNTPGMVVQVKNGEGRRGTAAATISNSRGNGVILQAVNVNPDDKLFCTGWVKGKGPGTITFGFRFQEKSGKWHARRDLESSIALASANTKDWQPVAFYLKAPENCGKVVVMLGAKNQKEDNCIWFDDIELFKLNDEK